MFRFAPAAALLAATLIGCSEPSPTAPEPNPAVIVEGINGLSGKTCVDLFAGQTTDAGDVCLSIAGEDLVVTYTTKDGWQLTDASLWVGTELRTWPATNTGNPKIGQFPFQSGILALGSLSHSFRIPLSTWGLTASQASCNRQSLLLAAHANVRYQNGDGTYRTETGWGDGQRMVTRGNWAMYFGAALTCIPNTPVSPTTRETAFAYGNGKATCFLQLPQLSTNRWGWSNGPLAQGNTYTFDIYAAAGQCDLTKGTRVGTLKVVYNGSTAAVTYQMAAGFTMDETHLYVGNQPLPKNGQGEWTVAPGQYPYTKNLTLAGTDTYTVTGLSGDIYVVAHAVVSGSF